jgi:hypothetical protein
VVVERLDHPGDFVVLLALILRADISTLAGSVAVSAVSIIGARVDALVVAQRLPVRTLQSSIDLAARVFGRWTAVGIGGLDARVGVGRWGGVRACIGF